MRKQHFSSLQFLVASVLIAALAVGIVACSPLQTALLFTSAKTAEHVDTPLSQKANNTFWTAFHAGQYERLKELRTLLLASYLEQPRDPNRARLLGLSYLWTIAERDRDTNAGPEITDAAILAERYLLEAYKLEPSDDRLPGFIGAIRLALGSIHQDERVTVEGYYTLLDGIKLYPEFNYFTFSDSLSSQPLGSDRFTESVDAMWTNVALCLNAPVNKNPDLAALSAQSQAFLDRKDQLSPRVRNVCLNSEKVPHNWEGFFLHFGDVLVKQGRADAAKIMYQQAKISPSYSTYPFKNILERNLQNADARAKAFQNPDVSQQPEMTNASSAQCMMCHQAK